YEKRKLGIFNLMNILGLSAGILIPILAIFSRGHFSPIIWMAACSPAIISSVVLVANHYQQYELARIIYFLLYPLVTTLSYALGIDAGIEFFFVLFNHLLAIFFIFYGLLLIRNENMRYQNQTRDKNWQLRRSNLKILRQKADLSGKAALLEEKTA